MIIAPGAPGEALRLARARAEQAFTFWRYIAPDMRDTAPCQTCPQEGAYLFRISGSRG